MIKYIPIILICATSTPKNECNQSNPATSVIRAEPQNTMMACLMSGQVFVSQKAYGPSDEHPSYVVVRCEPHQLDNGVNNE